MNSEAILVAFESVLYDSLNLFNAAWETIQIRHRCSCLSIQTNIAAERCAQTAYQDLQAKTIYELSIPSNLGHFKGHFVELLSHAIGRRR